MDKILEQLSHNDDILEQQWPDIYSHLEQDPIPVDAKLVLNALVNYLLSEPINSSSSSNIKDELITKTINVMINKEVSIEINDLVNAFICILDSTKFDSLYLLFLRTIYEKFEIGERLCSMPIETSLIEQILLSLQKNSFIINATEINELWQTFLTKTIFSTSSDTKNILNTQDTMKIMRTSFQQFYK